MLKISEMRDDVMGSFHNALYLGDIRERISIWRTQVRRRSPGFTHDSCLSTGQASGMTCCGPLHADWRVSNCLQAIGQRGGGLILPQALV